MKNTPLTQKHIDLGAKMAEFAGYNMPISYSGINQEHMVVREKVGMFDVSHMGEFMITGNGAMELVQKATSNDVAKLTPGKIQYSCLPNKDGGIVDDLLVYMIAENEYMLVVNASNIEKDWNWISGLNDTGAQMENISDTICLLAVQGPKAIEALQSLTPIDLKNMVYYTMDKGTFAGIDNVIVSATGYTGSGGFEIYASKENAAELWDAIMKAGADFGIEPVGLGARDTLRLEMGFCLYGNDIDDTTSPLEAGLGWITKLDTDFTNVDYLRNQKAEGLKKRLVAFEMIERGIPRQGYEIEDADGNTIGNVTSGTKGPAVDKAIGMGYVAVGNHKSDTEILICVRNKKLKAKVVRLPFYKV